jgi:acyl-CoA synthetase (AMP-forming)/AMP-acid ligase II
MPYDPQTQIYTNGDRIDIPGQSIFDFMFEYTGSANAPSRPQVQDPTWLIDSANGNTYTRSTALERTENIARGFHSMGLGPDDAVAIFSSNEVSQRCPALWGSFLGLMNRHPESGLRPGN